jgi:hypothetical protein
MGNILLDQYSLLHFSSGVIFYFFNISFILWNILHIFFEYIENTNIGIKIINKYLIDIWPGGKPAPDTIINISGDIIIGAFGWLFSYFLDYLGTKYGWYKPHLLK